ncbi:MAG: wax ester/triacylglycerol synthase family O-acyltransferase [Endozoicomonadaceae bacterium]|nr:wax ester/triacylglycerol synthase family O-acyltransferase [Endozoicomonadaceae bacterium]
MHQVSPQDNLFLHMESSSTPMHVGLLCIYDQSTTKTGQVRFKEVIQTFNARLHKMEPLRLRTVKVPFNLDYPYWIEDPDFDIEYHLRHIALPKPGDWRQLCIQVSRLHARPLDVNRPLWEATIIEGLDNIEGLPNNCFAILIKVHRAIFDRDVGGQLLAALHDLDSDTVTSPPEHPLTTERIPTHFELLSRAAVNRVRILGRYAHVAQRYALPAAKWLIKSCLTQQSSLRYAPRTRFNNCVSFHRSFDGIHFSLEEIKAIRDARRKTCFNDVIIAIIAGALRTYLRSKNELPDESLRAIFPLPDRPAKNSEKRVHHFSYVFPRLFTEIADPLERLRKIAAHDSLARKRSAWLNWQVADDVAKLFPSTLADLSLRAAVTYQTTRHARPLFNTFISSIAGPHIPLYHSGARMVASYGLDMIYDTVGLAHTAFSYNGSITISVTACRNMMPDPAFYMECLQRSFNQLQQSVVMAAQRKKEI